MANIGNHQVDTMANYSLDNHTEYAHNQTDLVANIGDDQMDSIPDDSFHDDDYNSGSFTNNGFNDNLDDCSAKYCFFNNTQYNHINDNSSSQHFHYHNDDNAHSLNNALHNNHIDGQSEQ